MNENTYRRKIMLAYASRYACGDCNSKFSATIKDLDLSFLGVEIILSCPTCGKLEKQRVDERDENKIGMAFIHMVDKFVTYPNQAAVIAMDAELQRVAEAPMKGVKEVMEHGVEKLGDIGESLEGIDSSMRSIAKRF